MNNDGERYGQESKNPVDHESRTEGAQGVESMAERLGRERDEYLELLQRTQAEFSNYQKRMKTQSEVDRIYAAGNLAADLLSALDNFELALDAARVSKAASIVEGLSLVKKQLLDALAKHGVLPIDALGKPFDPNLHEAITQRPDDNAAEGTVVAELARGYTLRERVLRPSKVAVSVRPDS
jgi:molecular chaperone GrpE